MRSKETTLVLRCFIFLNLLDGGDPTRESTEQSFLEKDDLFVALIMSFFNFIVL